MATYQDLNNLGSYGSIAALWASHPEGGVEGDYCTIGGVKYHWDKYARMWLASPNYGASPSRKLETFDGDVQVQNDLTVAGTLRAKHIKQPCCGLFASATALQSRYPNPEVGMWAIVGDTIPGAIYRCDTEGVWLATGETGGVDGIDLTPYAQTSDVEVLSTIVEPLVTRSTYSQTSLTAGYWYLALAEGDTADVSPRANPNIVTDPSYHQYKCLSLPVKAGDIVEVKTQGRWTARPWCVIDAERTVVAVASESYDAVTATLHIKQDGYVLVNCMADDFSGGISYLGQFLVTLTSNHAGLVGRIPKIEQRSQSMYGDVEYKASALTKGFLWRNSSETAVPDTMSQNADYGGIVIAVSAGDVVTVQTRSMSWHNTAWAVTDTSRTILENCPSTSDAVTKTLDIEQDGYVFINCASDYYDNFSVVHTRNKLRVLPLVCAALRKIWEQRMKADHPILTYYGHEGRRHWTPSELQHVLTHLYKSGSVSGVRGWFFPTLIYLEFFRTTDDGFGEENPGSNRKLIYNQKVTGHVYSPSRKLDWEWLLGRYFSEEEVSGEHEGLRALEESIGYWKSQIGIPARRHKVVLGLPCPYYEANFEGWGSITEEGEEVVLDMSEDEDRIRAIKWFIDELLHRFASKHYRHFDLGGLYWTEETTTNNEKVIGAIGEYVQSKGLQFYWVPFSDAKGRSEWSGLNVTDCWLQTGYFWKDGILETPALTEVDLRALVDEALGYGMSVEFEVSRHLFPRRGNGDYNTIDPILMSRLETLRRVFEEKGIFGRGDVAYYFDQDVIIRMSESENESVASYMDHLAEVINGPGSRTSAELSMLRHLLVE